MYQFIGDFRTAVILSILSRSTAQYPTVPPVGLCATVRCGFNTKCIEFNGTAGCFNTTCSSGEIFTECSSYCEPTCIPQNIACIQSCGPPSCQCMPGFVRDNGVCVDPRLCSNIGPTTPSYVDEPVTPALTTCDQALVQILCVTGNHCEIVNGTPQCVPDTGRVPRCADVRVKCVAGNHCENTPTGITCAPDPVCSANEEFNICASDCEETCFPLGRPCTTQCLPAKCQCKSGFVREAGQCIDPNTCPNSQKVSTTTLSYVDEPVTPLLTSCDQALILIQCVTGFHCEIVDGRPQCVPDAAPTPTSVTCASTLCAEGTYCEDIDGRPQCLKNPGPCAAAFCASGECIEYGDTLGCFNTTCGANEEFRQCASCEPTCGPIVPCVPLCFPPACQCVGGYVRDNGKCIRRTDCTDNYIRGKI